LDEISKNPTLVTLYSALLEFLDNALSEKNKKTRGPKVDNLTLLLNKINNKIFNNSSNIMLQCWTYDAKERISFKAILKQLENITNISDGK
jgi:hypothetical protein